MDEAHDYSMVVNSPKNDPGLQSSTYLNHLIFPMSIFMVNLNISHFRHHEVFFNSLVCTK